MQNMKRKSPGRWRDQNLSFSLAWLICQLRRLNSEEPIEQARLDHNHPQYYGDGVRSNKVFIIAAAMLMGSKGKRSKIYKGEMETAFKVVMEMVVPGYWLNNKENDDVREHPQGFGVGSKVVDHQS